MAMSGSLVFNYCQGAAVAVEYYGVASAACTVQRKPDFVCHQGRVVSLVHGQECNEMLPYPFFGCQGHEFPTQIVVDLYLSLLCAAAYGGNRRKVEWGHG